MVARGMVRLSSVSINGDEILLGLAGPNEVFGESLSTVEAYEAVAITDCDVLCISLSEINDSPRESLDKRELRGSSDQGRVPLVVNDL